MKKVDSKSDTNQDQSFFEEIDAAVHSTNLLFR